MNITVLTYNIHNTPQIMQNISSIVHLLTTSIIFIALQEFYYPMKPPLYFISFLQETFPEYNIKTERMFGIFSIVLHKKENISNDAKTKEITKYKSLKIGQGYFRSGTKGFVAIQYKDIIFVNSHLIAHAYNNKKRMNMVKEMFGMINEYFQDYHTIILAGDLNFRVKDRDDQFDDFKAKYEIFKEADINFSPTYKFNENSDDYNKKREPSYCDRIVCASNNRIKFVNYNSLTKIKSSDHRPVLLNLEILEKINKTPLLEKKINLGYKRMYTLILCEIYENIYLIIGIMLLILSIVLIRKEVKWLKRG